MPNSQEIYFGACDLQMEEFIDLAVFRRSMILGILFQGDLAIPDIFFFITHYIPEIIKSDEPTRNFIASALRSDAIIPVFRSSAHTTFRSSLEKIRSDGIQGVHPEADKVCDFLEEAVRGKKLHYRLWPDAAVSVGYKQILERCLWVEPTGAISPLFEQFWMRTRPVRTTIFDRLKPDDRGGYRRGDVMNAVHFHFSKSNKRIDDVKTIWSNLRDKTEAEDVKRLLKWFTYAYQFNQGRMFELSPSLAAMDDVDIEFSRNLAALSKEDEVGIIWNDEFAIPGELALLTVDPAFIFEVRNSTTGLDYFEAVENWQKQPSDETSNVLLDRLSRYTTELNRLFIARGRSILNWEWYIKAHIPENKIWNRTGIELAKDAIGGVVPHFGLFSLVGPLGAATYEWWPGSMRKLLGVNNRVRLEVEDWTKRTRIQSTLDMDASFK
jgi:hypothetical protein